MLISVGPRPRKLRINNTSLYATERDIAFAGAEEGEVVGDEYVLRQGSWKVGLCLRMSALVREHFPSEVGFLFATFFTYIVSLSSASSSGRKQVLLTANTTFLLRNRAV
jgi:hypothetical protein